MTAYEAFCEGIKYLDNLEPPTEWDHDARVILGVLYWLDNVERRMKDRKDYKRLGNVHSAIKSLRDLLEFKENEE